MGWSAKHHHTFWCCGATGNKGNASKCVGGSRTPCTSLCRAALVSVRQSGTDGGYTGQYEGEMTTNARGEYILRTAMPGSYGRPLHIHVVVSHPSAGYEFTEMVFRGDKTLDDESQQHGIVLEAVRLNDVEVLVGSFDLVLGRQ